MNTLTELKHSVLVNSLRHCQLFQGLPPEDLRHVLGIVTVKTLAKGDYVFHEGDPSVGFYIVQAGSINVHRVNAAGKEQVIHVFRPGESFAEASMAMPGGYPANACAVESSQVLLVQKTGFLALLRRQPELAIRMLASMSMHLRVIIGQLEDLTMKDVETRLANWLVKRCPPPANDQPCTIELNMTKRALAAELGTVSETFSRTLAIFRDQKLLTVKGRAITVLNPTKLRALLKRNLGE